MKLSSLLLGAAAASTAIFGASAQDDAAGLIAMWNSMTLQERTQTGLTFVQWYNREVLNLMREVRQNTGLFTPSNMIEYLTNTSEVDIDSELGRFSHTLLGDLSGSIYGDRAETVQSQSGASFANAYEHFFAIGMDLLAENDIELDNQGKQLADGKHKFDQYFHVEGRGGILMNNLKNFLELLGLDESSYNPVMDDMSTYDASYYSIKSGTPRARIYTKGSGKNVIIYVPSDLNGCESDSFPAGDVDLESRTLVCFEPFNVGSSDISFLPGDANAHLSTTLAAFIGELSVRNGPLECAHFTLVCRTTWSAACAHIGLISSLGAVTNTSIETIILNPPSGPDAVEYFDNLMYAPYLKKVEEQGCEGLKETYHYSKLIERNPDNAYILAHPDCDEMAKEYFEDQSEYLYRDDSVVGANNLYKAISDIPNPPFAPFRFPVRMSFVDCARSPLLYPFSFPARVKSLLDSKKLINYTGNTASCESYQFWPDELVYHVLNSVKC